MICGYLALLRRLVMIAAQCDKIVIIKPPRIVRCDRRYMVNRQIARTIYAVFKTSAAHIKIAFEYMCPLAFPLRRATEHINLFIIFILCLRLPRTRESFWVHSAAVYTRFKHYITCHLRAKQGRPPKISPLNVVFCYRILFIQGKNIGTDYYRHRLTATRESGDITSKAVIDLYFADYNYITDKM